jgi:hypothetical protein
MIPFHIVLHKIRLLYFLLFFYLVYSWRLWYVDVHTLGHKTKKKKQKKKKSNSVASIRERTIPTERPPPVNEVSVNFCSERVLCG